MGRDDRAATPAEGAVPHVHGNRAGRVGVTYAASGIGQALAAHLVEQGARVVGLDAVRGAVPGVVWRTGDPADPSLVKRLGGVGVLVHSALETTGDEDRANRAVRRVRSAQTVLTAAAAAGVPRVVLVTSAMVYGAAADNPVPLDEDAPLRGPADDSVAGDLLEVERLVERAREVHPGLAVTVVRPALVVGPGVDTFRTRHFAVPRLLVVKDSTPHWQFCHLDDLAAATAWSALGRVDGEVLTVGCQGYLSQEQIEDLSGLRRIELSARVATAAAERLHRLGVTSTPVSDIAYTAWPWVVSSARLRAAGWRPTYDNATALQVLLDEVAGRLSVGGRRVPAREAALGAAGTTVAVLSTAAVVRQVRRQRRGG